MSTPRGRPPKKRRGPDPQLTTSDGDIVGFRHLSVNSKRAYKREDSPGSPQSPDNETADNLPVQNKVGRPPLRPEKGPMRESSLQHTLCIYLFSYWHTSLRVTYNQATCDYYMAPYITEGGGCYTIANNSFTTLCAHHNGVYHTNVVL